MTMTNATESQTLTGPRTRPAWLYTTDGDQRDPCEVTLETLREQLYVKDQAVAMAMETVAELQDHLRVARQTVKHLQRDAQTLADALSMLTTEGFQARWPEAGE